MGGNNNSKYQKSVILQNVGIVGHPVGISRGTMIKAGIKKAWCICYEPSPPIKRKVAPIGRVPSDYTIPSDAAIRISESNLSIPDTQFASMLKRGASQQAPLMPYDTESRHSGQSVSEGLLGPDDYTCSSYAHASQSEEAWTMLENRAKDDLQLPITDSYIGRQCQQKRSPANSSRNSVVTDDGASFVSSVDPDIRYTEEQRAAFDAIDNFFSRMESDPDTVNYWDYDEQETEQEIEQDQHMTEKENSADGDLDKSLEGSAEELQNTPSEVLTFPRAHIQVQIYGTHNNKENKEQSDEENNQTESIDKDTKEKCGESQEFNTKAADASRGQTYSSERESEYKRAKTPTTQEKKVSEGNRDNTARSKQEQSSAYVTEDDTETEEIFVVQDIEEFEHIDASDEELSDIAEVEEETEKEQKTGMQSTRKRGGESVRKHQDEQKIPEMEPECGNEEQRKTTMESPEDIEPETLKSPEEGTHTEQVTETFEFETVENAEEPSVWEDMTYDIYDADISKSIQTSSAESAREHKTKQTKKRAKDMSRETIGKVNDSSSTDVEVSGKSKPVPKKSSSDSAKGHNAKKTKESVKDTSTEKTRETRKSSSTDVKLSGKSTATSVGPSRESTTDSSTKKSKESLKNWSKEKLEKSPLGQESSTEEDSSVGVIVIEVKPSYSDIVETSRKGKNIFDKAHVQAALENATPEERAKAFEIFKAVGGLNGFKASIKSQEQLEFVSTKTESSMSIRSEKVRRREIKRESIGSRRNSLGSRRDSLGSRRDSLGSRRESSGMRRKFPSTVTSMESTIENADLRSTKSGEKIGQKIKCVDSETDLRNVDNTSSGDMTQKISKQKQTSSGQKQKLPDSERKPVEKTSSGIMQTLEKTSSGKIKQSMKPKEQIHSEQTNNTVERTIPDKTKSRKQKPEGYTVDKDSILVDVDKTSSGDMPQKISKQKQTSSGQKQKSPDSERKPVEKISSGTMQKLEKTSSGKTKQSMKPKEQIHSEQTNNTVERTIPDKTKSRKQKPEGYTVDKDSILVDVDKTSSGDMTQKISKQKQTSSGQKQKLPDSGRKPVEKMSSGTMQKLEKTSSGKIKQSMKPTEQSHSEQTNNTVERTIPDKTKSRKQKPEGYTVDKDGSTELRPALAREKITVKKKKKKSHEKEEPVKDTDTVSTKHEPNIEDSLTAVEQVAFRRDTAPFTPGVVSGVPDLRRNVGNEKARKGNQKHKDSKPSTSRPGKNSEQMSVVTEQFEYENVSDTDLIMTNSELERIPISAFQASSALPTVELEGMSIDTTDSTALGRSNIKYKSKQGKGIFKQFNNPPATAEESLPRIGAQTTDSQMTNTSMIGNVGSTEYTLISLDSFSTTTIDGCS